jgi:adenosylhomocysteine nucleosidase
VGTTELISTYHPDLIISTGVAGGADISLEVMNVVVSTECTYHDVYCGSEVEYGQLIGTPARFKTTKNLVEKALEVNKKESSNTVVSGLIVTGDWFVDSQEKMRSILEKFPDAKAVDMESCAIAHTCHLYQIPFISFRIISDIPLKDNKASQYFDFWSRMAEGSFNVTKRFLELL